MTDKQEPSYTFADLQHAVRDINEHFGTKQKHVAKKEQIIDFIITTVGGSFGPDLENEGQTIWTDERGKSLSAQTIATYEALVDAGFGPKAEPETAAATAEPEPQPETAAGEPEATSSAENEAAATEPEPAVGEPQECPDFGKPLNKAKDEGYDPDSPDCQPDSCKRAAECAAAVAEATKAGKGSGGKKKASEPRSGEKSCFGHNKESQAGKIDELLAGGSSTMDEIIKSIGCNKSRVTGHIKHLEAKKGVKVTVTNNIYKAEKAA